MSRTIRRPHNLLRARGRRSYSSVVTDSFLAASPAFKKLPALALAELSRKLLLRRYHKAEPIFEEGRRADAVYLLRTGLVKAVKYSPRSDYASMEIIAPGQIFGMIAVMDDKPYPVSAIAMTACEAYWISSKTFSWLLNSYSEFSRQAYATIGEHIRQTQELMALSSASVERKIAHVLGVLFNSLGAVLPLRREDIAELAGCLPETAIRTLSALRKKGAISTGYKKITILDARLLQEILAQDD